VACRVVGSWSSILDRALFLAASQEAREAARGPKKRIDRRVIRQPQRQTSTTRTLKALLDN
jgi:hypothetical protein